MKKVFFLFVTSLSMFTNGYSQTSSTFGFFVGSSPCGNIIRPLLNMPLTAECEFTKWKITLHQDSVTRAPTTFNISCVYGIGQPNTSGFVGGGTKVEITGKWAIIKGSKANPEAVVYQLNPDQPEKLVSFVKLDDNVIHLLYSDKSLMIGNSGQSYTFNKIKNRP